MKTTDNSVKNYKYAVTFTGVFENADDNELTLAGKEIAEQFVAQLFDHIKTRSSLKNVANNIAAILTQQYNIRKEKLEPATPSAHMTIATKAESAEGTEAVAEEVEEEPESAPKRTRGGYRPRRATTATAKNADKSGKGVKNDKGEKKANNTEVKQVLIASLSAADVKKMNVRFVQYSEKCVSLTGDTKAIKDDIKRLAGGHWNSFRQCWFLKNEQGHALAKAMGCRVYKKAE